MAVLIYRDLVGRIRASQKTQQITKTMQMVAASRLKKSQDKFIQSKPYLEGLTEILKHLQSTDIPLVHPLLSARAIKKMVLVVVTSDRGLCGTYNTNVIHAAETFLNQQGAVELMVIGKKGDDYFKKRQWPIFKRYLDIAGKTNFVQIAEITETLTQAYRYGQFDAIYMVYTSYQSALAIRPALIRLFPIFSPIRSASANRQNGEGSLLSGDSTLEQSLEKPIRQGMKTYLEPSCGEILEKLLPAYVASKVYTSLLETFTAENSARMMAMKNATDNANEMIRHLTLLRNKARQGTITKELIDMVTACEALRG